MLDIMDSYDINVMTSRHCAVCVKSTAVRAFPKTYAAIFHGNSLRSGNLLYYKHPQREINRHFVLVLRNSSLPGAV